MPVSALPSHPLARRLLLSLGLVGGTGPGCFWLGGDCDVEPERVTLDLDARPEGDTGATTAEPLVDCPTDQVGIEALAEANETYVDAAGEITLVGQDGRLCTYEYTPFTCCGYGRPYLDPAGRPLQAPTTPDGAWAAGMATPSLEGLSGAQREALARFWEHNARAEHSSVAGFHRFALELLSHGAPPRLLARAQAGAVQELHHARLCFALSGAYAGAPVGPAAMRLGRTAPLSADLVELALWTLRDGAIGETVAAFLAEQAREAATDPVVRATLAVIVRDETEHAELAWATLQWALEEGGLPVVQAVEAALRQVSPPAGREPDLAVPSHGLPAADEEVALAARCLDEVVRPVARALLDRCRLAA
ncbi:ferritin-like domain-containing protein [Myxococcota bacterium]|nr:ferritin-like domain-containing protein [Myxococcota bacterium]